MNREFPAPFRTQIGFDVFMDRYKHDGCETWQLLSRVLAEQVCGKYLPKETVAAIAYAIETMKFIPGGRYLAYAGREVKFFNNCFLLAALEDTREDWAELSKKVELCLTTGGGVGGDYTVYRPKGSILKRTGGVSSGPIPKMKMVNDQGRWIRQGGGRRAALYASLLWTHGDIMEFLHCKNWHEMPVGKTGKTLYDIKQEDFEFPAPLDQTNISVNYNTEWIMNYMRTGDYGNVFLENVKQALTTGEPGFSFNFFDKETETLRNACTEVTSSDDSDVCNLGSVNMSRIDSIDDFAATVELATMFLLCGTLVADLPYEKVARVREKNRRLGLGLMGVHEWLLKRSSKYEVTPELHQWLSVYQGVSDGTSAAAADRLSVSRPVANRAIAPTGTIGTVAGTTTGIEPIFAVAFKRRYFKGERRHYQYVVDGSAQEMIKLGISPDKIEGAIDLAFDPERRIKFQADVQDYVDMGISSTLNLPAQKDQPFTPEEFAGTLAKYASRLRGITAYPDGSRGGQPLTSVPYEEAVSKLGKEFEEHTEWNDACVIGEGGFCGS